MLFEFNNTSSSQGRYNNVGAKHFGFVLFIVAFSMGSPPFPGYRTHFLQTESQGVRIRLAHYEAGKSFNQLRPFTGEGSTVVAIKIPAVGDEVQTGRLVEDLSAIVEWSARSDVHKVEIVLNDQGYSDLFFPKTDATSASLVLLILRTTQGEIFVSTGKLGSFLYDAINSGEVRLAQIGSEELSDHLADRLFATGKSGVTSFGDQKNTDMYLLFFFYAVLIWFIYNILNRSDSAERKRKEALSKSKRPLIFQTDKKSIDLPEAEVLAIEPDYAYLPKQIAKAKTSVAENVTDKSFFFTEQDSDLEEITPVFKPKKIKAEGVQIRDTSRSDSANHFSLPKAEISAIESSDVPRQVSKAKTSVAENVTNKSFFITEQDSDLEEIRPALKPKKSNPENVQNANTLKRNSANTLFVESGGLISPSNKSNSSLDPFETAESEGKELKHIFSPSIPKPQRLNSDAILILSKSFSDWCSVSGGGLMSRLSRFTWHAMKNNKLSNIRGVSIYRTTQLPNEVEVLLTKEVRPMMEYWLFEIEGLRLIYPAPLTAQRFRELSPVFHGDGSPSKLVSIIPAVAIETAHGFEIESKGFIAT